MFGAPQFEKPAIDPREASDEQNHGLTEEEIANLVYQRSEYAAAQNQEQQQRIENLLKINGRDPLTGAASRETFTEKLKAYLAQIRGELTEKRAGAEKIERISLIMIDVDHFSEVNNTLGHKAGDDVLKKLVETLMHSVRTEDMVARRSGEEFFVLLRDVDTTRAAEKAEEFRLKFENLTFDQYPDLKITASFGVISSDSTTDAERLEERSDMMMYRAKRKGRNRVEVYTPEKDKEK